MAKVTKECDEAKLACKVVQAKLSEAEKQNKELSAKFEASRQQCLVERSNADQEMAHVLMQVEALEAQCQELQAQLQDNGWVHHVTFKTQIDKSVYRTMNNPGMDNRERANLGTGSLHIIEMTHAEPS